MTARAVRALLVLVASAALACGGEGGANGPMASDGGAKPECASCHMPDYLHVRHPPHVDVKPTTCGVCHTQKSWHPSVLDHPWPLTGKHEKLDCFQCHTAKPPVFKGTDKKCVSCHKKEYDKPPFPDHNLFQLACAECHTTTDWKTLVPHPIWPPEPDAGAPDAGHDEPEVHDAGASAPKPKPKPKPPVVTPPKPPDVTTGGSRHVRGH